MITRDDELNINFGLNTFFDGDKYHLIMDRSEDEYPIGGLICEFFHLYNAVRIIEAGIVLHLKHESSGIGNPMTRSHLRMIWTNLE